MPQVKYWTKVLKRIFIVTISIISVFVLLKLACFYMPFLVAFIISLLMEPLIKKMMKKFKITRKLSSIIVFIITFGIIITILGFGISSLISESTNLLEKLNDYYNIISEKMKYLMNSFDFSKIKVSDEIKNLFQNAGFSCLEKISVWVQKFLSNLINIITQVPTFCIYFGITILSLYFICTDKIYILDEFEHHLPKKWMKKLSKHLREIIKTLGGYLKAQLTLILISFIICLIGLYIFYFLKLNVKYPLLIALGIGFVDALPILGSGSVMVPWAIISGLNGDIKLGICIISLWLIMTLTRQFIEPKIVSGNIGIHPIFTILAMYTGFKFIGVIGMFVGPIVLIILKNLFGNIIDGGILKTLFDLE